LPSAPSATPQSAQSPPTTLEKGIDFASSSASLRAGRRNSFSRDDAFVNSIMSYWCAGQKLSITKPPYFRAGIQKAARQRHDASPRQFTMPLSQLLNTTKSALNSGYKLRRIKIPSSCRSNHALRSQAGKLRLSGFTKPR
jgi:hypothetical protein